MDSWWNKRTDRTLLQIFAPKPAPDGPQWISRWPMCERMGWACLNASSVPPTRKDKVPALAPVAPSKCEPFCMRKNIFVTSGNGCIDHTCTSCIDILGYITRNCDV